MGDRAAKDALYDAFVTVAKALSSGRRAEIVDVLAQGERSVDELAGDIQQSVANTSHHLQALARAGLVVSRRKGTRIIYRLASAHVEQLWSALRSVATEHVAGIGDVIAAYVGDRSMVETIDAAELEARLRLGRVVVIDVRPAVEYTAGHIAGARSVPIDELHERLRELPADTEIVAYCRGPYCVYADDAVRELTARGFKARRLADGFPEWRRGGLPVAVIQ